MAIDKALDYKERGASEAFLNQFLSANGLDPSILNDWTAEKTTELSPADYLTAMKGITDLYEGGFRDAAGAVADMYGISRDALNYTPQYITGSYSGRSSGAREIRNLRRPMLSCWPWGMTIWICRTLTPERTATGTRCNITT